LPEQDFAHTRQVAAGIRFSRTPLFHVFPIANTRQPETRLTAGDISLAFETTSRRRRFDERSEKKSPGRRPDALQKNRLNSGVNQMYFLGGGPMMGFIDHRYFFNDGC